MKGGNFKGNCIFNLKEQMEMRYKEGRQGGRQVVLVGASPMRSGERGGEMGELERRPGKVVIG
jgi:hypothetical protein